MSVNYYIKNKISKSDVDEVLKTINQEDWSEAIFLLQDIRDKEYIHIGSSSCGWRFCLQYLPQYGPERDVTIECIYKLIEDCLKKGSELVDEYDAPITLDKLKNLIESKQQYKPHGSDYHNFVSKDGYDWGRSEFS